MKFGFLQNEHWNCPKYWSCQVVLGNFLFSELFIREYFSPAFRIYLYFCQKHTPKIRKFNVLPNFTCGKGFNPVRWTIIYAVETRDARIRIKFRRNFRFRPVLPGFGFVRPFFAHCCPFFAQIRPNSPVFHPVSPRFRPNSPGFGFVRFCPNSPGFVRIRSSSKIRIRASLVYTSSETTSRLWQNPKVPVIPLLSRLFQQVVTPLLERNSIF